jgi:predicted small secreted protein
LPARITLLHILPDNTVNPDFSPNPNSTVIALHLHGSTLYVSGWFSQIGGQPRQYLAAIDATTGAAASWSPNPNSIVNSIIRDDNTVYVGGSFTIISGRAQNYFAMLDANTAEVLSLLSVNSTVHAIEQDDDNVYLGGWFSGAQGLQARYGALLETGDDFPAMNFPGFNSTVNISIPDGSGGWYVGGSFTGVGGKNNLLHIFT